MILRRFNVEKVTDDPSCITNLIAEGYVPVKRQGRPQPPAADYSSMKKAELEKIAEEKGIRNAKKIRKNDLVQMLEERR